MGKPKKNCMVYTPNNVVKKMLDILGYTQNLYGKKILENSCGEGQFLMEIVSRYIEDCQQNGYSETQICRGLEQDIFGYEIDENAYQLCLCNLDSLVASYSFPSIHWNINRSDALKSGSDMAFSYVVGNPPYITYSALSINDRSYIRENFHVCAEGKPDYYFAFIESAIMNMDNYGRLVYLVPNNFFKTRFAHKLREYILPTLTEIYDYTNKQIFDSALTSSAILVCDNSAKISTVNYYDVVNNETLSLKKEDLKERWLFYPTTLRRTITSEKKRFGDCFSASSSIATLYNEAYIIDVDSDDYKFMEKEVLRSAASPKSLANKKTECIIYPYYYDTEGALQRYTDAEFNNRFPCTYNHLKKHSDKLMERNSDKTASWFEYGRSQAIAHMNQQKLLLSTLVTNKVVIHELDEYTIPYAGFYIVAKPGFKLTDAKRLLESADFFAYANRVGVHANGKSFRISIRDVNNYQYYE